MSLANRWFLYGPFLAAAAILLAWFGVWSAGAGAMREALAEFAAREAEAGGAVSYSPLRARGFPFFLRGEIGKVSIARGRYGFEADAVYLHASPFAPGRLVFSASPTFRLATPEGLWQVKADAARASIEADGGGWIFKAEAALLDAVNEADAIRLGRSVINIAPDAQDGASHAVSVRVLDARIATPRGATEIARLDAALSVSPKQRAAAVHGFDAEIGAARARLSGALTVDPQGFLAGRLDAAIDHPESLADVLRMAGAVDDDDRLALEAGLAMLASAGGGAIAAPIDFSNGEIKLAGVKVARAPRLSQP